MIQPPDHGSSSRSYWYDDTIPERDLLRALRRMREAEKDMRRRASQRMGLNPTDMTALRLIVAAEQTEDPLTATDLAAELQISGPSTAKLLNRLTASGHVRRMRHPRDGRSVILCAEDAAHEQLRATMTAPHERMLEAARHVPEESRQAIVDFLEATAEAMEGPVGVYQQEKDCDE